MEDMKRIVEVNGVKIEVDLRTAKVIENYKVGDPVKLLKKDYSNNFKSHPAVIVGFDEFKNRPTIIVCFLNSGYNSTSIEFAYLNKDSADFEIAPMQDFERKVSFDTVARQYDKEIDNLTEAVNKKVKEKEWFVENYKRFFGKMFSEFGADVTENQI